MFQTCRHLRKNTHRGRRHGKHEDLRWASFSVSFAGSLRMSSPVCFLFCLFGGWIREDCEYWDGAGYRYRCSKHTQQCGDVHQCPVTHDFASMLMGEKRFADLAAKKCILDGCPRNITKNTSPKMPQRVHKRVSTPYIYRNEGNRQAISKLRQD